MKRVRRILITLAALLVFGLGAVTATFFLVGLTEEDGERNLVNPDDPPPPPTLLARYATWLQGVVGSGFTDWGRSATVASVNAIVRERLPVTATLGVSAWLLGWGGGLLIAVGMAIRWPGGAQFYLKTLHPAIQAVPRFAIVLLAFIVMAFVAPDAPRGTRLVVAAITLAAMLLPSSSALWLNAVLRVTNREFVRVLRGKGISGGRLWMRHVLPNCVVSSGVLTMAAVSLAALCVGSIFAEKIFHLGGIANEFIVATMSGQSELAATAVVIFFVPLASGVLLAETVVGLLDPDQVDRG